MGKFNDPVSRDLNARSTQRAKTQAKAKGGGSKAKSTKNFNMKDLIDDRFEARMEKQRIRDAYNQLPEFTADWFKDSIEYPTIQHDMEKVPMQHRRFTMLAFSKSKACFEELAIEHDSVGVELFQRNWISLMPTICKLKHGEIHEWIAQPDGWDNGLKVMIKRVI